MSECCNLCSRTPTCKLTAYCRADAKECAKQSTVCSMHACSLSVRINLRLLIFAATRLQLQCGQCRPAIYIWLGHTAFSAKRLRPVDFASLGPPHRWSDCRWVGAATAYSNNTAWPDFSNFRLQSKTQIAPGMKHSSPLPRLALPESGICAWRSPCTKCLGTIFWRSRGAWSCTANLMDLVLPWPGLQSATTVCLFVCHCDLTGGVDSGISL